MKSSTFLTAMAVLLTSSSIAQEGVQTIAPYSIEVSYDKTTHLIFATAIQYVDLGNETLIADKAGAAENVLRVKAKTTDFHSPTNLSVITLDGRYYNFDVHYNPLPEQLSIDFSQVEKQKIASKHIAKTDILFSSTGVESPAMAQLIMQSIYEQKKNYIKHIGSKNARIQILLKGIYVHNGKLYLDFWGYNRSQLPFEVDFVTFKVVDKKTSKKSIQQELEISPLRSHFPLEKIAPKKHTRAVYMIDQLTLSDEKVLRIEFFEKQGSRYQALYITAEDVQNARVIKHVSLH